MCLPNDSSYQGMNESDTVFLAKQELHEGSLLRILSVQPWTASLDHGSALLTQPGCS